MTIEEIYKIYKQYPVITTDSRNCPENSIFIALKGGNFDGNTFAEQALILGCAYAIADDPALSSNNRIIIVDDCLKTLQDLAKYHREQIGTFIIAITGTNGKTTTKELMAAVLSAKFNVLYTQGNLNNHIGVPLTLLRLTSDHQLAIIEMGANHPGEIKTLAEIARPDIGLITNVGKAHLEGFGSFEAIIKTKGELYDYIRSSGGRIMINYENKILNEIAGNIEKIYYGKSPESFVWGNVLEEESYSYGSPFLAFEWHWNSLLFKVTTKLIGIYNLENALAAICVGCFMEVPPEDICRALQDYMPHNNRSQLKETQKNHLIIDAYNANPTSMLTALENFSDMKVSPKAFILGDMKELGESTIDEHLKIVAFLKEHKFEKVYLCGTIFASLPDIPFFVFKDVNELNTELIRHPLIGHYVLIKGSRSVRLENAIESL